MGYSRYAGAEAAQENRDVPVVRGPGRGVAANFGRHWALPGRGYAAVRGSGSGGVRDGAGKAPGPRGPAGVMAPSGRIPRLAPGLWPSRVRGTKS